VGSLPNLIKLHLAAAWRRKWWATAAVWVTCVLGWLYLAYIPDQFESSARMYVDSDAILVPLLKGIAIDTGSVNQADLMQKTLLSPSNVDKLIEMTALSSRVKTAEQRERLNRALSQAIQVSSREKNLFTVTYRDANPELARDVVQAGLTIFLANQTGSSQAEMLNAQRFLREQIANYERQLTEAENRRAEFRAKYFDLLPGATNTASRLQTARAALGAKETELADSRTRLDALKQQLQSIPKVLDSGSPFILQAGTPSLGQQRLAEAERNLDNLRLRFTEAHPDVIAAHKLVDSLRAAGTGASASPSGGAAHEPLSGRTVSNAVYEQVRLRAVDMAINVASLEQKIDADKKDVERLEALAREAPGVEADYERLDRDYTVLKKNHDELVTRLESAKIASAADSSADSKVRIIDPPRIAQVPVAPKRQVLISAVLLAAIGVGGGIVFLLQQIDQSFNSVQALRQLGLPVLGGISLAVSATGWRSRRGTIGFIAVTVMLFVVYGGLMLAASKLRLTI
jgi:polysaccharide chain length determinant protein (PEP-CTERM system associated)